ncbi:uncharacterized protein Z518_02686 [Rhinocladiella mackenziei CBS 650.93]|uniref:Uncharacterized protein n=1 Tax=Rhinocladiella mackenziei CBS 650.93 TaxID=1442369 RepID=A0A0D2IXH9_9EURO|nr:uncharacterized protein Z518_02686 [Rhinocladiella mackenziei CBS 650.93]KIX08031.1 hypothetical protein Z518_02686 [Rhinocladiella mackenziei CBS 650.93]
MGQLGSIEETEGDTMSGLPKDSSPRDNNQSPLPQEEDDAKKTSSPSQTKLTLKNTHIRADSAASSSPKTTPTQNSLLERRSNWNRRLRWRPRPRWRRNPMDTWDKDMENFRMSREPMFTHGRSSNIERGSSGTQPDDCQTGTPDTEPF